MTENPIDFQDCSFTKFADAYLALHRSGKAPGLDEAIEEFPHLESQIRERLPSLLLLEETLGTPGNDPLIEQPIDGCRLLEEIGRGACGVVYRGHQSDLNRDVAVKAITLRAGQESTSQRFGLESQAMARLEHPNIVPVYGFAQIDSRAYLTMKLIDGFSLDRLMRGDCNYRGTILLHTLRTDCGLFAALARDVALALAHAHRSGLVHRDIKPSNLMLDQSGKVWVTDFGLAKMHDYSESLSRTGDVIGTPRYMAPEQLRGSSDARSDIYSLGLTLYEIATGCQARSLGDSGQPSPDRREIREHVPDFPQELQQVIEKAAAFAPEDRYQTAEELAVVLDRFLKGLKPDRRKRRRKPNAAFQRSWKMKLGLALGIAVLGPLAYLASRSTESAKLSPQDLTLIEFLADNPENRVPTYLREVTLGSVEQASEELGLNSEEKDELISGIEGYITDLEQRELPKETISEVARRYQESPLATATRVLIVNQLIVDSNLESEQRARATATTRKLAFLIGGGALSQQDGQRILDALTGQQRLRLRELKQLKLTDRQLLQWVLVVEAAIAPYDTTGVSLAEELDKLFEGLPRTSPDAVQEIETHLQGISENEIRQHLDRLPADVQDWARQRLKERETP